MKLNPEVFRVAAEFNFMRKRNLPPSKEEVACVPEFSKHSCGNIVEAEAVINGDDSQSFRLSDYGRYYQKIYCYDSGQHSNSFWWACNKEGSWDYESRIYALLLAAEMAEDELKEA